MRFLIDANMPRSIIALVTNLGHEVEFARDVGLAAAPDQGLDVCRKRRRTPRNRGAGSREIPAGAGLRLSRRWLRLSLNPKHLSRRYI